MLIMRTANNNIMLIMRMRPACRRQANIRYCFGLQIFVIYSERSDTFGLFGLF
jgi:hypothetical protein